MPSSIFNFSREVPARAWPRYLVMVAVIFLIVMAGWEMTCRRDGYAPTLNDNAYQWCLMREKVRMNDPNEVVIIGSSRALFDLRLDILTGLRDRKPAQLSLVGSNPRGVLAHLARETDFSGTVLCGVTPVLFFAPGGPPVERTEEALKRYREFSPSQRMGQYLGIFLQQHLAFIQQEDLTLNALLQRLPWQNRPQAKLPPRLPPYLNTLEPDRQAALINKGDKNKAFMDDVKSVWQGLFAVPGLPDFLRDQILEDVTADVHRLEARGGRVIFLRMPSTGWLLEKETELTPREGFWDKLLAATGCQGVYFADYPELTGFDCPEWSHLSREDSITFTKRLFPILKTMLK